MQLGVALPLTDIGGAPDDVRDFRAGGRGGRV